MDTIEELQLRFRQFAAEAHDQVSPLYEHVSKRIADDPTLLEIASSAPVNQPIGNLFLASIQYLLMLEGERFDPNGSFDTAFEKIQEIALKRRPDVEALLVSRLVQTNEVRRSTYLYAAFARISREFATRRFELIELGASAGLNLLFDRYEYDFGGSPFGNLGSSLRLSSEVRGENVPPTNPGEFVITRRTGMDLNPLDVENPDDLMWLRALIWPEHTGRLALLDAAVMIRQRPPVRMIAGDGVALLKEIVEDVPEGNIPFVFHTHVANQLPQELRHKLLQDIDLLGSQRDLVHLHNNIEPHLHATVFREGRRIDIPLARTDGHARWIEWID